MQKSSETVLLNLKDVRENPPSLNVSVAPGMLDSADVQSGVNETNPIRENIDVAADTIDWDIAVDRAQIDWDIGTVEEAEDAGNGLGPYEIVNASEILQSSSQDQVVESDQISLNKKEDILPPKVSVSEISWDISVETPQVDVIDDGNLLNVGQEKNKVYFLDTRTQTPEIKEDRSQLLETEYRNKILDDLYEVYFHII